MNLPMLIDAVNRRVGKSKSFVHNRDARFSKFVFRSQLPIASCVNLSGKDKVFGDSSTSGGAGMISANTNIGFHS
jgi:hypothetical protein